MKSWDMAQSVGVSLILIALLAASVCGEDMKKEESMSQEDWDVIRDLDFLEMMEMLDEELEALEEMDMVDQMDSIDASDEQGSNP